jgi:hypothetical protein
VSENGDLPPDYTLVGQIKENHKVSAATLGKVGAVAVGPGPDGEETVPREPLMIISVQPTEGCLATGSPYQCN